MKKKLLEARVKWRNKEQQRVLNEVVMMGVMMMAVVVTNMLTKELVEKDNYSPFIHNCNKPYKENSPGGNDNE